MSTTFFNMAISTSPTGLVLLTGATGHIGFRTLVHALRTGLNVRATVRSEAKAKALLIQLSRKVPNLNLGEIPTTHPSKGRQQRRLTFTIVPDITSEGAYDHAMEDVTHVIHVASPLVTGSQEPPIGHKPADDFFIRPAVQGTLSLLKAADYCGTVRRVVITSSIVSLIPVEQMEGTQPRPRNTPVKPTDRVPFTHGPYHSEFAAYANSKIAALDAAETWYETTRPAFDIVHLHPSFVLGRNDMATTPAQCMKGTNAAVLAMLLGRSFGPFAGATVHIDDVASCHVAAAVDIQHVPGNQSYILSQESTWNDAMEIAQRSFSSTLDARLLSGKGNIDTTVIEVDASLTENTFDFQFREYEDQVQSLVAQYLELRAASKQNARNTTARRRENDFVRSTKVLLV